MLARVRSAEHRARAREIGGIDHEFRERNREFRSKRLLYRVRKARVHAHGIAAARIDARLVERILQRQAVVDEEGRNLEHCGKDLAPA